MLNVDVLLTTVVQVVRYIFHFYSPMLYISRHNSNLFLKHETKRTIGALKLTLLKREYKICMWWSQYE